MASLSKGIFPSGSAISLDVNFGMTLFEFHDAYGTPSRPSRVANS